MKNFFRAVKLGMRYRFTLLGAIVCSLMVALFWGANIGTVYPVVEVVFQGKAMTDWIDGEINRLEDLPYSPFTFRDFPLTFREFP